MNQASHTLSFKTKITLWFSLTFCLLVGITLALTFSISRSVFDTDIQSQLTARVDANAQEIEFFNSLSGQEIEVGDQYLSYRNGYLEIDDDFCDYLNGVYTCLVDEDNQLLYGESPIRLNAGQAFTFTQVDTIKYKGERYYIYERPLQGESLDGLWLRGVASRREGTHLLASIMKLVMYLLPALALLAVLVGYLITRRAFRPVKEIIHTAESITGGDDLSLRIDLPPGNDEFHQLTASYNNMLDRLEAAFQREKQFTSDVSHELRTPVSVILSQCEYSLELDEEPEEFRQALHVIKTQGNKMKDMITQLLFFSRLQQGRQPLHTSPADLSALTRRICGEQAQIAAADKRNISIRQNISAGVFLLMDSHLYEQLLQNLISNGIKYGRDNGYVEVSLTRQPAEAEQNGQESLVVLKVSDNGIGIAAEHLPHIWSRFYQVDPSRSSTRSGVGLGLAMVREIALLYHGTVACESVPDQGSTFIVTFPAATSAVLPDAAPDAVRDIPDV